MAPPCAAREASWHTLRKGAAAPLRPMVVLCCLQPGIHEIHWAGMDAASME